MEERQDKTQDSFFVSKAMWLLLLPSCSFLYVPACELHQFVVDFNPRSKLQKFDNKMTAAPVITVAFPECCVRKSGINSNMFQLE